MKERRQDSTWLAVQTGANLSRRGQTVRRATAAAADLTLPVQNLRPPRHIRWAVGQGPVIAMLVLALQRTSDKAREAEREVRRPHGVADQELLPPRARRIHLELADEPWGALLGGPTRGMLHLSKTPPSTRPRRRADSRWSAALDTWSLLGSESVVESALNSRAGAVGTLALAAVLPGKVERMSPGVAEWRSDSSSRSWPTFRGLLQKLAGRGAFPAALRKSSWAVTVQTLAGRTDWRNLNPPPNVSKPMPRN